MNPKDKRARLFKKGKPFIRPVQIYNGSGYSKDIGILWTAYKRDPLKIFGEGLDQQTFAERVEELANKADLLFVDDENRGYENKGPIMFMALYSDGWKAEPFAQFFPWATPKNKLRASVSFLHWVRYSKEIGVFVIHALKNDITLLNRCKDHGVLFYSGKIIGGNPYGNEYIFSVRGGKDGTKNID